MAVVYLDLDGFKQINNTLGHGAGDTLLKMVAERLVGTVREEDTVARLGGDEFIIGLWHLSGTTDAATVASKVIEAVSEPYGIEGLGVSIRDGIRQQLRATQAQAQAIAEASKLDIGAPVREREQGRRRCGHLARSSPICLQLGRRNGRGGDGSTRGMVGLAAK
jgi:GGDEF domain-containing protein